MRLFLLGMLGLCVFGQEADRSGERLWKVSLVSLGAAHALDTHSSWGKCESNAFIAGRAGRFDAGSVALKSGVLSGLAMFEWATGRRHPKLFKIFSAVNLGVSAGLVGVAARNYGIAPPGPGYSCR